jgi:hypothetical protein
VLGSFRNHKHLSRPNVHETVPEIDP